MRILKCEIFVSDVELKFWGFFLMQCDVRLGLGIR